MEEIHWTRQVTFPLLALIQLVPLAGALLTAALREWRGAVRLAQAVALAELLLAMQLFHLLAPHSGAFQFAEALSLAGPLAYHAAADGVTVLFVLFSALLTLLLALYSPERRLPDMPQLLATILAVEAVLMSLLATLNLLWFVIASAAELGLVGYLMWRWASAPEKDLALRRFYQFQGIGLLLLLAGALMLGWQHSGHAEGAWSFDLLELARAPVAGTLGSVVFFLLFYGMAVRTPLFPLHGWLPVVMQHGNVAIAPTFLLGIKVGIYGMVRFVFPLLPEAVSQWNHYAVAFATAGVFYAAFLAFLQQELRRLMAFAVVSHTSLLVIGLFTLHAAAFQGALLLTVNFGLAATTMLFMTGLVYRRTRTTKLSMMGGLFDRMPLVGIAFLVSGLAIVGMPGTPGFDAAHLVLEASIERYGALLTVASALGNVLAAGFLLWAFQRAFLAPPPPGTPWHPVERAGAMERALAVTVIALQLAAGFYLEPWLDTIEAPLKLLGARYGAQ